MTTLALTFTFIADAQGFTATPGAATTMAYDAATGNPAGCLSQSITGKNLSNNNKWELITTYEALGVPKGSTVTGITSASCTTSCTAYTTGLSSGTGATFLDGATTVTLASNKTFTGTYVYAGNGQTGIDNTGMSSPSSNSVTIRWSATLATGNSSSANVVLKQDLMAFTITYTTGPWNMLTPGGKLSYRSIDKGLIGHWPLNEGAGTKCYDTSGNNHTGTLSGGSIPTWVRDPRFGTVLQLNGNGTVDFGNIGDIVGGNFSIVYWTKFTSTYTQFNSVIGKETTSTPFYGWYIYMDETSGGYGVMKVMDAGGTQATAAASTTAATGLWHLIAGVLDRQTQLVKISIDGRAFATGATGSVGSLSNSATFQLGLSGQTATMHDVRYYCWALSLAEVNQIYKLPSKVPPIGGRMHQALDTAVNQNFTTREPTIRRVVRPRIVR